MPKVSRHFIEKRRKIVSGHNAVLDEKRKKYNSKRAAVEGKTVPPRPKKVVKPSANEARKNIHQVKNWMPQSSSMDEATQKFFLERISTYADSEPAIRQSSDALHAMDRTYPSRRNMVVQSPPIPVRQILSTYPLLKEAEQLLKEFERVTGKDISLVERKISEYGPTLISKASEKNKIAKNLAEKRLLYLNEKMFSRDHSAAILALLCIPLCLKEKWSSFFMAEDVASMSCPRIIAPSLDFEDPCVIFSGEIEFTLMVEDEPIFTSNDFNKTFFSAFCMLLYFRSLG